MAEALIELTATLSGIQKGLVGLGGPDNPSAGVRAPVLALAGLCRIAPPGGPKSGVMRASIHLSRKNTAMLALLARLWNRFDEAFDISYRPEKHFMRGPGPKARRRQAATAKSAQG